MKEQQTEIMDTNEFHTLYEKSKKLIDNARNSMGQMANTITVLTSFLLGQYIVEQEQQGSERAKYGAKVLDSLSAYLTEEYGRGFRTNGEKVGWKNDIQGRERAYASRDWVTLPDRIMEAAERLRGVQIECKPAIEVIKRFNFGNVLIYADPPYILSTRHGKQYRHEMDDADHEQLLLALLAHKGPVLLSGYDNELYNELLKGWYRKETTTYSQVCSKKREILWMNFRPAETKQLTLFGLEE